MRIDKFLKVSRVIKRRTVANDACDAGHISVNGKVAKASYDLKVGDVCPICGNKIESLRSGGHFKALFRELDAECSKAEADFTLKERSCNEAMARVEALRKGLESEAALVVEEKARIDAGRRETLTEAKFYGAADEMGLSEKLISILSHAERRLEVSVPVEIDFMKVSSYSKGTVSTGRVNILLDLNRRDLSECDVLIVEDIIDSGRTLSYLVDYLHLNGARSVRTCTLLDKPDRRVVDFVPDYRGFVIPDEFVVGYGLDYAEQYRALPYIGVLKPEVYEKRV